MENRLIFDSHPSDDVLEEYVFLRLSEPDCAEFEEHLLLCPRCQHNLAKTDEYVRLMKHASARHRDQPSPVEVYKSPAWRSPIGAILGVGALIAAFAFAIPHYSWRPSAQGSPAELVALRGASGPAMASARAGTPVGILIDTTDLDDPHGLHIQVVDADGKPVWSGEAPEPAAGNRILVRINTRLRAGVYWIRLYSPAGELLREFGLRAE